MKSYLSAMIKYLTSIRKAASELKDEKYKMFQPKGFIESFELGETKVSGAKVNPEALQNLDKTARKKDRDDEEGYYEEEGLDLAGDEDEEGFSGRRTTLLDDEDQDPSEMEEFVAEEEVASPEKDPVFKQVLENEQKQNATQRRLDLIRERAEALKKRKMGPEEVSTAVETPPADQVVVEREELEPAPATPQPAVVEEDDKSLSEEEAADDAEEADESGEDGDEVDGEKKRGRKKGQTSEGRQPEDSYISSLEDLRVSAYDLDAMKAYGIPDRKIDQIFDLDAYTAKNKSKEEPELWEMAADYIDPASEKSKNALENLIAESYDSLMRFRLAETDYEGEKAEMSSDRIEKIKAGIKKVVENKKKEELAAYSSADSAEADDSEDSDPKKPKGKSVIKREERRRKNAFNQMEIDFMTKYFSNLKNNFAKKTNIVEDRVQALRESKSDDKEDRDLAKRILEKEKKK